MLLQQPLTSHAWPFSPSCWTHTSVTAQCYLPSGLCLALLASQLLSDGVSGSHTPHSGLRIQGEFGMLSQLPFLQRQSPLSSHLTSQDFFFLRSRTAAMLGLYFPVLWFRKCLWEEAEGKLGAPGGFPALRDCSHALVVILCLPAVGIYTLSRFVVKSGGKVQWQPVWSLVVGRY